MPSIGRRRARRARCPNRRGTGRSARRWRGRRRRPASRSSATSRCRPRCSRAPRRPLTCGPFAEWPFSSHETEVVAFFVTQCRAVSTRFGAMSAPEQSSNVVPMPTRSATTPAIALLSSSLSPPKMLGSVVLALTRVSTGWSVTSVAQPAVATASTRAGSHDGPPAIQHVLPTLWVAVAGFRYLAANGASRHRVRPVPLHYVCRRATAQACGDRAQP